MLITDTVSQNRGIVQKSRETGIPSNYNAKVKSIWLKESSIEVEASSTYQGHKKDHNQALGIDAMENAPLGGTMLVAEENIEIESTLTCLISSI